MNENVEMQMMEFEEKLNKTFNHLIDEYMLIRVGRANPKILENIMVDYYGTRTPLKQTCNITVQDARMIIVSPWDVSTLKSLRSGIEAANLGLSIGDDGRIIRVGFPMLTEERRKEFSKDAKKLLEECKVAMRNFRRDVLEVFKTMKKNAEISEDEYNTLEKDVQKSLDGYTAKADTACEKKIEEIKEV